MKRIQGKTNGLIIVLTAYIAALAIAYLCYPFLTDYHPVVIAAVLDIIGTIVIFIFSVAFNNSSIYDPYWSVAPLPIALYWMYTGIHPPSPVAWVIFGLICFWGMRLTINWARRWEGLQDEDWRYVDFRKKFPGFYWPISFLGIHLFPTILVFLGCLAIYPALTTDSNTFNLNEFIAIIVTLAAVFIEWTSDEQLKAFLRKRKSPDDFLTTGLWKLSRHPNYFGEVTFWLGLSIFSFDKNIFEWWVLAGPLAMILLFAFISVPMIDKRMAERKPGYGYYMKKSSGLVLWFPKK